MDFVGVARAPDHQRLVSERELVGDGEARNEPGEYGEAALARFNQIAGAGISPVMVGGLTPLAGMLCLLPAVKLRRISRD